MKTIICKECGEAKRNHGHGYCHKCYMKFQMRERRKKFPEQFRELDKARWNGKRKETCNKNRVKRYYEHYEEEIEKRSEYRDEHREEIHAQQKEYYQRNLDVIRARNREYNKRRDKTKEFARLRAWVEKQPIEKIRKIWRRQSQNRMARKNNLLATLTVAEWEEIKKTFDYKCAYCGERKELVQEHKTPLIRGGAYTKDNIVPSCASCNSKKGTHTYEEYIELIQNHKMKSP